MNKVPVLFVLAWSFVAINLARNHVGDWLKEGTVIYGQAGNLLTFDGKGTLINGTSLTVKGNRPLVGGILKREPPDPKGIVWYATVIQPGDVYLTNLKNGKQIAVEHDF